MGTTFSLYPTLTESLKSKFRYQPGDYYCYYCNGQEDIDLQLESIDNSSNSFKVSDSKGIWNPDDHNWGFRREYKFKTYNCLFGRDGIACKNAIIGVAILWTSTSSKQRGIIEVGEIRNNISTDTYLETEVLFEKAQLRGIAEFTTILYVKNVDVKNSIEEKHLANKQGYILGELDKISIVLDGKGSMFPIYEVIEPMQPLWYIKCLWDDPTYDQFSEVVSVYINKAHKNYKYLDQNKKTYDEQLIKEIMSSALMIIVTKIKESDYWPQTENGESLQPGSVSEAVYYFIKTLNWNTQTPELLSVSIRNYFDKNILG